MNNKSIFTVMFLFVLVIGFGQKIERIEPPNWWVGMKESKVQIMLTGSNIGKAVPSVTYKGVKIEKFGSPDNPDFLFIDLIIKRNTTPGNIPIALNNGSGPDTVINYPILEREKGAAARIGFNTTDAIYLITPDRFANANSANDYVKGMQDGLDRADHFGRHGGDLEGIRQNLDYITDLGFTSIWLNPILENDMPQASYHGYATTDFYKVDPRFGTNDSYRNLCAEASAKGIKMIMDMITNHIGLEHPWMSALPTRDWINYYNQPYVETNHLKNISMDPYAAKEDADILTKGWFVKAMPDLNVTNTYLGNYLIQNAVWWIEYAGLAGIRLDTYLYPDEEFMSRWSARIMREYPKFNIVGELWHDNPSIISYWQKGKKNPNGYVSNLPSLFDFPLHTALMRSLNNDDNGSEPWMPLYEMLGQDFQYADPHKMVVFTDNHDMDRTYTQLGKNMTKFKNAMAYLCSIRGTPQIFYGTEILMTNDARNNHGEIRSDYPGGWAEDEVNAFTGKGLTRDQKEARAFMSNLLKWRKKSDVIHHGNIIHYVPHDGVYVYFRIHEKKKIMVVLNHSEKPVLLDPVRFKSIVGDATRGEDIISGSMIKLSETIKVPGGPMIIEIK